MSELVKRLRDHYGDRVGVRRDMESAADRIEALEAARAVDLQVCADQLEQNTATMNTAAARIEALEAALRVIIKVKGADPWIDVEAMQAIARTALAEPPPGMHKFTDANGPDE